MNNKHFKRKKYTRKVILLNNKDSRERIILTLAVKKREESLKIKTQCDTQPEKEVITVTQNETYPVFRAQLKDRIVPCCLRGKCRKNIQNKTNQCKKYRQRKTKQRSKSLHKVENISTVSTITPSDEEYDGLQYEDISSCTDDEIDTLLESTRKRIKDSQKDWKLLPRQSLINEKSAKKNIYNRLSKSPSQNSINSLETLVLEDLEKKVLSTPKFNELYSPITSPEQIIKLLPLESNHTGVKRRLTYEPTLMCKEYFHKNEDVLQFNPQKKIKLEPLEVNNSREKHTFIYESKQSVQQIENFHKNKDQTTHQQRNAAYPKAVSKQNIIKPEPNNNKIIKCETNYVSIEDKEKYEIETILTNDIINDSKLNLDLIELKQELYADI